MNSNGNGISKEVADQLLTLVKEKYDPLALLTAQQASKLINVSPKSIDYYARTGQLPKIQVGRHIRYSPIALVYWYIQKHGEPYRRPGERENHGP